MWSTQHELLARDSNQAHPRSPMDLVLRTPHHKHKIPSRSRICLALTTRYQENNPRILPGATPRVGTRHITFLPKLSHCVAFVWRVYLHC